MDSYLIEITADILKQRDPEHPDAFLVDYILDSAEQKGTGKWTSINALDMGIPANSIAEAVFARCLSALKSEREAASRHLIGPVYRYEGDRSELIRAVHDALYCSKICAYAQGFQLMRAAQSEYGWNLDFASIASIWRGGCIIRARFLQKITDAYNGNARLVNLLTGSRTSKNRYKTIRRAGALSWRSRLRRESPRLRSCRRWPIMTAIDRKNFRQTCYKLSGIISAPTPTSVSINREVYISTLNGPHQTVLRAKLPNKNVDILGTQATGNCVVGMNRVKFAITQRFDV